MKIGVPKEIKNNEYRVALTPAGVKEFVRRGHEVYLEKSAGIGSGFSDDDYQRAGAHIVDVKTVYGNSEMIYKVKEILPPEYGYMREGLIIFTYIHSNANREMTSVLLDNKVIGIAYEDIVDKKGDFPLLRPMSELAGKGGFIAGLNFCQSINGGTGKLLAGVHGVRTPKVTIIGGGAAGIGAAELASGFGNKVVVLDISMDKLEEAKYKLPANVELLYSNRINLEECLKSSDVIINCLLWDKTRKDHLIYRGDLKLMKQGSIIVDVSCDEEGAIETCRATSHDDPIYSVDGIIHYAVDNIPSAFSETATIALSNVTLPYALEIANKGCDIALKENKGLRRGLTFYHGAMTLKETSIKQDIPYISPEEALGIL
ncbi:MAG: alanine dehydrogenase [Maledivibacter sp.]|jgi:alanine dehydrogenase|nr:alanine dehydrogenase [Maledivibacter sp.]